MILMFWFLWALISNDNYFFLDVGICQLRLDFVDVALTQPNDANGCAGIDNIGIVAGGGLNPPNLCGTLDGEHSKYLAIS